MLYGNVQFGLFVTRPIKLFRLGLAEDQELLGYPCFGQVCRVSISQALQVRDGNCSHQLQPRVQGICFVALVSQAHPSCCATLRRAWRSDASAAMMSLGTVQAFQTSILKTSSDVEPYITS